MTKVERSEQISVIAEILMTDILKGKDQNRVRPRPTKGNILFRERESTTES